MATTVTPAALALTLTGYAVTISASTANPPTSKLPQYPQVLFDRKTRTYYIGDKYRIN